MIWREWGGQVLIVYVHGIGARDESEAKRSERARLFRDVFASRIGARDVVVEQLSWAHLTPEVNFDKFFDDSSAILLGGEQKVEQGGAPFSQLAPDEKLAVAFEAAVEQGDSATQAEIIKCFQSGARLGQLVRSASSQRPAEPWEAAFGDLIDDSAAGEDDAARMLGRSDLVLNLISTLERELRDIPKRLGGFERLLRTAFRFPVTDALFYMMSERYEQIDTIKLAVRAQLLAALNRHAGDDHRHVLLIGHSFGGVILADILHDESPAELAHRPTALVSVGSQVSLFLELAEGARRMAGLPEIRGLPNIDRWVNVYNSLDFAGLPAKAFGARDVVEDAKWNSPDFAKNILQAHTTYFDRPDFHAHLGARLKQELYGFDLSYSKR